MISRCFRFFLFLPLLLLVTVPALARQTPGGCLEGNPGSHRRQRSGGL